MIGFIQVFDAKVGILLLPGLQEEPSAVCLQKINDAGLTGAAAGWQQGRDYMYM